MSEQGVASSACPEPSPREQVAVVTPLPPTRTGVAHYSSMLIPALQRHIRVEVISSPDLLPSRSPLLALYHLGNNPHHEWIYEEAMRTPGVVVLHDVVLHHLIVEMTLARGDAAGYIAALRESHGEVGAAWARGRAAGLHLEISNFLLPASSAVANRSRAVIVHNRWAAELLRSHGVRTPIHVVGHPYEPALDARGRREEIRARHSFAGDERVVGLFGFLTSAKRSEVVLAAFARARATEPRLRLLVVGEPAPDIDVDAFRADGVTFTGYVSDEEFAAYFAAVDRLVNLRYPSAGETSGTLIRAFDAGKPVAVSDYAQFAELPDECAAKIPFGDREVDSLAGFLVRDLPDSAPAQRAWLDEHASMEKTVEGYLAALAPAPPVTDHASPVTRSLPLFPSIEAHLAGMSLAIRNTGDMTLRARTYGAPGYRLIVNGRWFDLPRDLAPGEAAEIDLPPLGWPLRLEHGIQSIPSVEHEAFATMERP